MTSDEAGLIAAIRDDPDDDAARLVYADWLDDHGLAARAELIRLQCADETPESRQRVRQLLAAHAAEWLGPLAGRDVSFVRGLLAVKWKTLEQVDKEAALLKQSGVPAAEVTLELENATTSEADLTAFVASPRLAVLTNLSVQLYGEALTSATPRALAASRHARHLRGLSLHFGDFSDGGAEALAESKHLTRLLGLGFRAGTLGADAVSTLCNSRALASLARLWFVCAVQTEPEIVALAEADGLPGLTLLSLTGNRIRDGRLRHVLRSPLVGRLEELMFHVNSIGDRGARSLANCTALAGLRKLDLSNNALRDEGVQALLDSPTLARLQRLDVRYNSRVSAEMHGRVEARFGRRP